eukprot:3910336-Prymnesium_polylepis.1
MPPRGVSSCPGGPIRLLRSLRYFWRWGSASGCADYRSTVGGLQSVRREFRAIHGIRDSNDSALYAMSSAMADAPDLTGPRLSLATA